MKWFRTATWGERIVGFDIIKETAKQITYINENGWERREAKLSDHNSWHETWEEAQSFLLSKHASKIKGVAARLQREKDEWQKVVELTP